MRPTSPTRTSQPPVRSDLPRCLLLLLAAALLVAVPPVLAAGGSSSEGENEAEAEEGEKESQERVYTNEDLQRYRSKAGRKGALVVDMTAKGTPGSGTMAGVAAMDAGAKKKRMAELEKEIQEAEERIRAIDARERSLRNPFLPRPALTEKEAADEAGMDSRQKLEQLQAERAALAKKLPGLRADLETLARTPTLPADAGPPGKTPGASGKKPTPDRPKP
jgi:hypothetical protein